MIGIGFSDWGAGLGVGLMGALATLAAGFCEIGCERLIFGDGSVGGAWGGTGSGTDCSVGFGGGRRDVIGAVFLKL